MATSNSTNYTLTAGEIIESALEPVGMAQAGEPLEPEDAKTALRVLNIQLKALQKKLNIWKRKTLSITLVAGQHVYTIGRKSAGTITSVPVNTQPVDSGANYNTDDVVVNDNVTKTSLGTTVAITSVLSANQFETTAITWSIGDAYTITDADIDAPRPIEVLECNRKRSDGSEVTINKLTRNEYEALSNKTSPGPPIDYHYDPTINNGTLYIWQEPDAAAVSEWTVELVYQATIEDVDSVNDNIDIPAENLDALEAQLSYKLSSRFGSLSASDKAILRQDAKDALDLAEGYDQESGSVMTYPELREYY